MSTKQQLTCVIRKEKLNSLTLVDQQRNGQVELATSTLHICQAKSLEGEPCITPSCTYSIQHHISKSTLVSQFVLQHNVFVRSERDPKMKYSFTRLEILE